MYNSIAIEELGTPAVVLINEYFQGEYKRAASEKRMPLLRATIETVPCECHSSEEAEAGVNTAMDDIISALTRPLSEEEKSPKSKEEKPSRIVFTGDLEEVNRFYYKRGWTDGLPILPPTEEAVGEMMKGVDFPPEHVVANIVPRAGKATVEKIAINAVMAGALPTYMPLLTAGVQALADPKSGLGVWSVSTGSWTAFWTINGPVCRDLNINQSVGVLGPGNIANATIGRAMSLIMKNIGGSRPGIEDMSQLGHPGRYTQVVAENEEENPWEPLHVDRGLKNEDSAISVFFPHDQVYVWPYGTDASAILKAIVHNIPPGSNHELGVLMNPVHAKRLADEGWTKQEVKTYIAEFASIPAYRHPYRYGQTRRKAFVPLTDMDSVRLIYSPDDVHIVTSGGKGGNFVGLFIGFRLPGSDVRPVTKKVELPANWGTLVDKYKDMVPTYIRY